MNEHIQSGVSRPARNRQLEQVENALADAKRHLLVIPRHNTKALEIQKGIIADYERQVAVLKGEQWLS